MKMNTRNVLLLGISTAFAYLIYVLWSAFHGGPQGPDGITVKPVVQSEQTSTRKMRNPKINAHALGSDDIDPNVVRNWDAILTLAHLSSEVYSGSRVEFAREKAGFDVAKPIDHGNRHSMVCSNTDVVVVAFRGTATLSDIVLDGNVAPAPIGTVENSYSVHSGFHRGCVDLYDELVSEIVRQGGQRKRLIVTGHSLGGAMAVVFAYLAETRDGLHAKSIITFGQPLIGNEKFTGALVKLFGPRHRRFVHRNDLVSRVARPYFHSGSRILLIDKSPPVYWSPAILTKTADDDLELYSSDPKILPLSDDELSQVREYATSQASQPTTDVTRMVGDDVTMWIKQGLEDHKMQHYIKCIEAQQVESDE